jgi:hypothetical protein
MVNESALQELLISAFEKLKAQQTALMNAMVQVAALRDTLYEMGPRFQDAFERRLVEEQATIAPDIQKAELAYDAIIRAVKGV